MAIATAAQLDALRALLSTAERLAAELGADAVGRLLRAFTSLPPDDREAVTQVLERGAAWHRIADATADLVGVRLRANPHARLFVRTVDPREGDLQVAQERDEILLGILRLVKLAPLLVRADVAATWRDPAIDAVQALDADERAACADLARVVLALIAEVEAEGRRSAPA